MKFIFELLGGVGSRISSKRSVMIWFVLLYTYLILLNAHTGKSPSATFQEQLFELLCLSIVVVFGEGAFQIWKMIKGKDTTLPPPPADPK